MAPKQNKRPSPLDDPPTASSSDSSGEDEAPSSHPHPGEEDEEEASSEEQQQEEDDDEEEEEEEEQPQQQSQPVSKNPPPTPAKPASSESDTESGSESESDSPPPVSNFEVKPKASKPMEQTPKPKQKPSASKRPAENNGHVNDPKRSKKKKVTEATAAAVAASSDDEVEEDAKKSGAADSRKTFQRLWSEEDELAILKGMAEFKSKTGNDPTKYSEAFHDFMKKSLQAEASSNQLREKIRRLKKKFEINAGKVKNGQGPSFSKPHDQESFELSKKVWGNAGAGGNANGAVEKAKSNGKSAKSPKKEASKTNVAPSKPKPETKHEVASKETKEAEKMDIDEKIDTTPQLLELIRVEKGFGLYGLSEHMLKRGVELIGASQRAELEEQWKELQVAELEVAAKRADLVAKQTKLIFEAYKSSNY